MNQFSKIRSAYPINKKILFFEGNDSHFSDRSQTKIQKKMQPLILKAGESINNQPNDNGPNSKLISLYKFLKAKWMLKYGTTMFKPHHRNSVLVETCEAFMVSDGNIIRYRFTTTYLPSLIPTNMITNTQACVSSIQTSSKGINHISEEPLATIKLQVTRTNNPMAIIREKVSIKQPSRNILLRQAANNTTKNRTFLPIKEMKREFMIILKKKKVNQQMRTPPPRGTLIRLR